VNKMSWKKILKNQRPDYPDLDGDGDKEEPMVDALRTVEEVESTKKSPRRKHYTKDGKQWKGKTHKMPDGSLMTENPHNEKSVKLYHKEELPKSKARGAFTDR
tara:strand:- start:447 stop:755 length:309 start_codon:yes stop_codon:yes gene_type:complete